MEFETNAVVRTNLPPDRNQRSHTDPGFCHLGSVEEAGWMRLQIVPCLRVQEPAYTCSGFRLAHTRPKYLCDLVLTYIYAMNIRPTGVPTSALGPSYHFADARVGFYAMID